MCTHECFNLHRYLIFFAEKGGKTCWSVSWLLDSFLLPPTIVCLNLIAALVLFEGPVHINI